MSDAHQAPRAPPGMIPQDIPWVRVMVRVTVRSHGNPGAIPWCVQRCSSVLGTAGLAAVAAIQIYSAEPVDYVITTRTRCWATRALLKWGTIPTTLWRFFGPQSLSVNVTRWSIWITPSTMPCPCWQRVSFSRGEKPGSHGSPICYGQRVGFQRTILLLSHYEYDDDSPLCSSDGSLESSVGGLFSALRDYVPFCWICVSAEALCIPLRSNAHLRHGVPWLVSHATALPD
jgi:hypothetical protein